MIYKAIEYCLSIIFTPLFAAYLIPYGELMRGRTRLAVDNQRKYLAFITASFIFEKLFIVIYLDITEIYGKMYLVQSGFILTIILIVAGKATNLFYDRLIYDSQIGVLLDSNINEKTFIMAMMTIVCSMDFIMINRNVSVFCISLLLGKYFWFDSGMISRQQMMKEIWSSWKNVSSSAKYKSLVFAWIVLLSNYCGYIAAKKYEVFSSYSVASIFAVGFSGIYIGYCSYMRKKDEAKWAALKHKNK